MSEVANEESELTQELGQLVRVLTGSGMQYQEARFRREQMRAAEQARMQQQQHAHNKALANLVHETLHDRQFWATAGSEAIADNVIAAAHLSQDHPKAQQAYMHAADMLRNDFGINLEDINRDHPTSLSDRHAALRDELDSYFERLRVQNERDSSSQRVVIEPSLVLDTKERLEIEGNNPIVMEPKEPPLQIEGKLLREEQASAAKAEQYAAEHRQDKLHAQTEAITGGREPYPYQRVTAEQYEQLRRTTAPMYAEVRQRQGLMFARSTRDGIKHGISNQSGRPIPKAHIRSYPMKREVGLTK